MRYLIILAFVALLACGSTEESGEGDTPSGPVTADPTPAVEAAPPAEAALPGDPGPGAEIYQAYCLACHMPDGTGLSGTLAADWVNDMSRRAKSDAELLESIASGVEETTMVAWSAMLSEQQRKDVLAYVRVTFMGHSGKR
jgi:mono/diheme cytochrome c family protein